MLIPERPPNIIEKLNTTTSLTRGEIGIDNYKRRRQERAILTLSRLEDVLQWGWTCETLLEKLIAFDRRIIGVQLTDEREGTVQQWAPLFLAHPETWILLTKGPKKIIGYWHFAALNDAQFSRIKSGELLDSEVTLDVVENLDIPGTYNLYFTLLGILPKYKGAGAKLIGAFYDQLESLANHGVFFREICANAYTPDGIRICEGIGMTKLCSHYDCGEVYSLLMNPWPARLKHRRWGELSQSYENALSS